MLRLTGWFAFSVSMSVPHYAEEAKDLTHDVCDAITVPVLHTFLALQKLRPRPCSAEATGMPEEKHSTGTQKRTTDNGRAFAPHDAFSSFDYQSSGGSASYRSTLSGTCKTAGIIAFSPRDEQVRRGSGAMLPVPLQDTSRKWMIRIKTEKVTGISCHSNSVTSGAM